MTDDVHITQEGRSWLQGALDGFHGKPAAPSPTDPLAYASGRIEGIAWREQGLDLAEQLRRNRLPYPAPKP